MKPVAFVQFLLPHGEQRHTTIDMPDEVAVFGGELREAGYRFEIEVLRTGHIHADVCDDEGQLASEVCSNGPEVPVAIERMIRTAHSRWLLMGRAVAS